MLIRPFLLCVGAGLLAAFGARVGAADAVPVASFETAVAVSPALRIVAIDAPERATPGERVRVIVHTNEPDPLKLDIRCAGMRQGAYAPVEVIGSKGARVDAAALSGHLYSSLTFRLPVAAGANPPAGYVLWARGSAGWVNFTGVRGGVEVGKESFSMAGAGMQWRKLSEFVPAGMYDSLTLAVAKGEGLDCVIASPDVSFDPRQGGEPVGSLKNNEFFLTMPSLLLGKHIVQVLVSRGAEQAQAEIAITVSDQPAAASMTAGLRAGACEWVDLLSAANLTALEPQARILDEQTAGRGRVALDEVALSFPVDKPAFVGVWKAVEERALTQKDVTVAQADDKVRTAQRLPQRVEIALGRAAPALGFVHAERGAGELGDLLWQYEIRYVDGTVETLPVREGGAVSGLLKGEEPEAARLVWSGLTDGAPAKVYLHRWDNPQPQKEVASVAMIAVKEKIIPVLLGLAILPAPVEQPAHVAQTGADLTVVAADDAVRARVEVNFAAPVRAVRRGLFSMNNPYMVSKRAEFKQRGMRMVLGEDSWGVYKAMDFAYDRIWVGGWLPANPEEEIVFGEGFAFNDLAMRRMGRETRTKIILNINPPAWAYSDAPDLPSRQERAAALCVQLLEHALKNAWPVEYVELFNETLIRHPRAEVERKYACFNIIAAAVRARFPQLKIAGTAECWPAVEVLEDFVKNCGRHLDAVSWHLYPTGSTASATELIMRNSPQMAKSSVRIAQMLRRVAPEREIRQLITEYNINYAAWKDGGEQRHKNGIGAVWMLSVLKHLLYEGEAEVANYWHYEFGKPYSVGSDPGARLSPTGEMFLLLNRQMRGSMTACASDDPAVESLASSDGRTALLALLNCSAQTRTVGVRNFSRPLPAAAARTVKHSFGGDSLEVRRELLSADGFEPQGTFDVTLPPYSAVVYQMDAAAREH